MTRATPLILLLLLLVMLGPGVACAQTYIHGSLSGTLGPGTYIVDGMCTVAAGNTLTIQPGTSFLFAGHYSIKVYGQMTAIGTEQDSIKFVRQNPTADHDWSGIRFFSGSSPNSSLSYCLIDHSAWQNWPDTNGGGVYVYGVGITISHCKITNCMSSAGGGMYVASAGVTVDNCIFFNNTAGNGGGIYVYSCNGTNVQNCIFAKNSATST